MKRMNKQKGFTIIELVVVILLLGILTATALPRFMDVTDDAHEAVADAVSGGLATGVALIKAQWYGEQQPELTAVVGFGAGTLFANSSGNPIGADALFAGTANTVDAEGATDCAFIYTNLLQSGAPVVQAITATGATAATQETDIETAATTTDIVASTATIAGTITDCVYYYVGQYKSGQDGDPSPIRVIPRITYETDTGNVIVGTFSLQVD